MQNTGRSLFAVMALAAGVLLALAVFQVPQPWRAILVAWLLVCATLGTLVVRLVRRGGVVNFFGGCPSGSQVSLDTSLLHYSEITCKASFHHTPDHVRRALDLISQGVITARGFVNRVEPLTNLLSVMRHLTSHNGHLKTAIIP